jgi:hypothetical protein
MMPQKRGDDGLFGSSFLRKAASKQGPQGSADSQSGCMLTGGMYSRGSLAYQARAGESPRDFAHLFKPVGVSMRLGLVGPPARQRGVRPRAALPRHAERYHPVGS